jgi:hypothetical protein
MPDIVSGTQSVNGEINLNAGVNRLRLYVKTGTGTLTTIAITDNPPATTPQEVQSPVIKKIKDRKPMSFARDDYNLAGVNGKVYAISGKNNYLNGVLKSVEEYDPSTDTWSQKADIPEGRYGYSNAVYQGKIFVIGGANKDVTSRVDVFDPSSNTWVQKTSMTTARYGQGSCELNGKIYVIGGYSGKATLPTLEVYDIATDKWEKKKDLPLPATKLSVISANSKVYAIGGKDSNGNTLKIVYEYNPANDTWIKKADLKTPRWGLAVTVQSDMITVIGGYNDKIVTSTEQYDLAKDSWSYYADLTYGRFNTSASTVENNIFVMGGRNYDLGGCLAINEEVFKDNVAANSIITDQSVPKTGHYKVYFNSANLSNKQISKVVFPTWTDSNGQDDLNSDWGNNCKGYYDAKNDRWYMTCM